MDALDPRLRLVSDYQSRLKPAIGRALDDLDRLVQQLTGPLDCSARTWFGDPRLRALFSAPTDMAQVFSSTNAVQSYFGLPENALFEECHAVLLALRQEKRQIGCSLEGETLTGDAVYTSVSFVNHRIALVANELDAVRMALTLRGIDFIAEHTLGLIHIAHNGAMSLESRLDLLVKVLSEVPDICYVNSISLRLDAMNRQVPENDGAVFELTEICARRREPQIVVLVHFPRTELMDWRSIVRAAELFLGCRQNSSQS